MASALGGGMMLMGLVVEEVRPVESVTVSFTVHDVVSVMVLVSMLGAATPGPTATVGAVASAESSWVPLGQISSHL